MTEGTGIEETGGTCGITEGETSEGVKTNEGLEMVGLDGEIEGDKLDTELT